MANIHDSRLNDRMKQFNIFLMNKRNRLVEDAKEATEMKIKILQEDLEVEIKRIDEDMKREGEIEFLKMKEQMEKERLFKEKEPDGKDQ